LAFAHGHTAQILQLFTSSDRFLVGSGRSVVTAQHEQTGPLFPEAGGRHPRRGIVVACVGDGLKAPAGLLQQRQGLLRSVPCLQYPSQQEEGRCQVVVRLGIGRFPRRLGLLQQLLRTCQGLPQLLSRQLLLDAGAAGLKACVRPALAQGCGGGLAHPSQPLQQPWFAQPPQ
jgi:hypothetical protein